MPANLKTKRTSAVDTSALILTPYFDGVTGPYWHASRIVIQAGRAASYCLINIPVGSVDEVAPAVTATGSSPVEGIRIGTKVRVEGTAASGAAVLLFVGRVVEISQDLDKDEAVIRALDERWLLEAMPLVGSFWISGDTGVSYRQGWPMRVNAGDQPNAVFRKPPGHDEAVPVFCPPNYGLDDAVSPADYTEGNENQAHLWTSAGLLQYIRFALSEAAHTLAAKFRWYPKLPSTIQWPAGYQEIIYTDGDGDRAAPEKAFDAPNALALLSEIISGSGPFALFLGPKQTEDSNGTKSYSNTLSIVRTRYNGSGVSLRKPSSGGADTAFASPKVISGGSLNLDGKDIYTRWVVSGKLVLIERRVDGTAGSFVKAWSQDDLDAFKKLVEDQLNGDVKFDEAVRAAARQYWMVGAAFRLATTFDYQAGTSESAFPRAEIGRPILAHLLSSFLENTKGSMQVDKYRFRREVFFEYFDADLSQWLLAGLGDNFSVDADGTVWLTGLREQITLQGNDAVSPTLKITQSGTKPNITVTITERDLRATVVIPADHRLELDYQSSSDKSKASPAITGINDEDADRLDDFTRMRYATAGKYGIEERIGAWPIPEAVLNATAAPDKPGSGTFGDTTAFLRNDSNALLSHLKDIARDWGRLERGGVLVMPHASLVFLPGQKIKDLSGYPVRGVVRSVTIESSDASQRTLLGLS